MSPINSAPLGGTGITAVGKTTWDAVRRTLLSFDSRIKYLEKNRRPQPTPMGGLANASSLQQAQSGHAPVYQPYDGVPGVGFTPHPVLATMVFDMPGALGLYQSDPVHARYPCNIVGISADLASYSSDVTFELLIDDFSIQTVTMTSASTGFISVPDHNVLVPYEELVSVQTTDIGTGNEGLVVHVELSVDVNIVNE